jgi:4-hydroxy-tetrahydrodipicolinate synthase
MGEGPMLKDEEWPYLLRTTVQAAGDKAAVVCGLHYKDTKRTIEDAKRAQDMGAIGLQVCPPIFNIPTQSDLLHYFSDLSDAIDIGIMVYCTHWMPGGRVEVDSILKMADFAQVAAIKWSTPDDIAYEEMAKFSDTFNVIDNGGGPAECHKLGGRGYINLTLESYPPHDLKIWDLLENKQYDEAAALFNSVDEPLREFSDTVGARTGGQGVVKKGIMALMGQSAGGSRPPSEPMTEAELEGLREVLLSFGWPVKATAAQAAA